MAITLKERLALQAAGETQRARRSCISLLCTFPVWTTLCGVNCAKRLAFQGLATT